MHPALLLAQGGIWTWVSGDNTFNPPPVFGTQGVPSVNNHPAGFYELCEWKDKAGNFWVYGGGSYYADLWKFNPATNEWTWVNGNGLLNMPPIAGAIGVPDVNNNPGYRGWGVVTWVDTTGNLWLFGGSPARNDLWNYSISTNEWTWMGGDTTINNGMAVHGIQGIPSPLNAPGRRVEVASSWTDSLNNLWLFGGFGFGDNGFGGFLNDVMKYDISSNEWTWMAGSNNAGAARNYGIKGIASPSNDPGCRHTYSKWKDLQGNFWMMGGLGVAGACLNDVWKFDPGINQWTWMAGTNLINDPGNYQGYCLSDSSYTPSCRYEHRSTATDNCGNFWLFGGADWSSGDNYNDLWFFDSNQLTWSWISGTHIPNATGNFGILGVPSTANMPHAGSGAVAWWGDDNRFYLYGGFYSVIWQFTPDTSCVKVCYTSPPDIVFSASSPLCPGTCADFMNLTFNGDTYQWSFPGASPDTSTDINPTNICYATPGNYDVQLIASNANGSDTLFISNYITVYPFPPPQSITQSGDTLYAIAGSASYQWYFNGNIINGATDFFYVASVSGDYNVVATDDNGCEVEAVIYNVLAGLPSTVDRGRLTIFPNPVTDELIIKNEVPMGIGIKIEAAGIAIYNVVGQEVLRIVDCKLPTVDCRLLSPGIYVIEIISDSKAYRSRFVKQ